MPCSVSPDGGVLCTSGTELGGSCSMSSLYWPHMEAQCETYIGPDFRVHKNIGIAFVNRSGQVWVFKEVTAIDAPLVE